MLICNNTIKSSQKVNDEQGGTHSHKNKWQTKLCSSQEVILISLSELFSPGNSCSTAHHIIKNCIHHVIAAGVVLVPPQIQFFLLQVGSYQFLLTIYHMYLFEDIQSMCWIPSQTYHDRGVQWQGFLSFFLVGLFDINMELSVLLFELQILRIILFQNAWRSHVTDNSGKR